MDEQSRAKLFQIADEQRSHGALDLLAIIQSARGAGMQLGIEEVRFLAARLPPYSGAIIAPDWLGEFIAAYQKHSGVKTILDPLASSLLLAPVVESLNPELALGVVPELRMLELAESIGMHTSTTWIPGDPYDAPELIDDLAKQSGGGFDLIMSCPPLGVRSTAVALKSNSGMISLRDTEQALLILRSSLHLAPEGTGIFVVLNHFIQPDNPRSVYANLAEFGLAVDAALAMPERSFLPQSNVPTTLVIIRRAGSKRLFVGALSTDGRRNLELVNNLRARKNGADVSMGALVDRSRFRNFAALVAQETAHTRARALGVKPITLASIAIEMNFTSETRFPGFTEQPNAVYLPLVGRGDVVTSLTHAKLKRPSEYVQIVLDPSQAVDAYVAGFFNTSLGRLLREAALIGNYVLRTSRQSLPDIEVYLPDRETQLATIEANTKIVNLHSDLAELQDKLWAAPRRVKETSRQIASLNHEERFADWLDTLPFPLASILWTYTTVAGDDHQRRYERLLHFFEALAEYLSAVLLSGFQTEPEFFVEKKSELRRVLAESKLNLDIAGFGTWVNIAGNLAREARSWCSGKPDDQRRCMTMFRLADRDVLAILFSSEIIEVLQRANALRNQWTGHGGVVGDSQATQRHALLNNLLATVRSAYSSQWANYQLIKAHTSRFAGGVYTYDVERLMGTRTPFERTDVQTDEPMESGGLYLLANGERKPLKLFPLVKVMPSPRTEENACYFYNRIERNGQRFVSHHFAQDADITDNFPDTLNAIMEIIRDEGKS